MGCRGSGWWDGATGLVSVGVDVRSVVRWTVTTGATVGAAAGVFGVGAVFPGLSQGWVQTTAGLVAAVVAAPLSVWATTAGTQPAPTGPVVEPVLPVARSVPIPLNREFTGRDVLLQSVFDRLTASGTAVVQALHGMGGVGKTQVAARYAREHWSRYRIVWWIAAEAPALIGARFAELAAVLGLVRPGDEAGVVVERVMAHLRGTADWLLVFDNADSPADVEKWLPGGGGHVVITSRVGGWDHLGGSVEIAEMDRVEAVALLRRRMPGLSDDDADRLANTLGEACRLTQRNRHHMYATHQHASAM
jgi:hypothetical protein